MFNRLILIHANMREEKGVMGGTKSDATNIIQPTMDSKALPVCQYVNKIKSLLVRVQLLTLFECMHN